MADDIFDVIVVGGGIHGAGVVQAAAAAGYSVLLLEKTEIAAATSSKSSKLIHGGLRYLESFQLSLVRECLKERATLLALAPELVKLVPFYIPVYQTTSRRPWKIHAGLWLYKMLAGDGASNYKKLAKQQWDSLDGLKQDNLQAVFCYSDAQTDDMELTKAVVRSAQLLGAEVLLPAEVVKTEILQDMCIVHVNCGGRQLIYKARVMVNAAGRWANHILTQCEPVQQTLAVDYVQGTHIIIDTPTKNGVFYLEAPSDKRAVFVMPWENKVLVGTTETKIDDPFQDIAPLPFECEYLLDVYNYYFSQSSGADNRILSSFAGLRVLPRGGGSVFSRKRETILLVNSDSKPRVISLFGGKLTAYRSTAEKVLLRIGSSLPERKMRARTDQLSLTPDI